MCRGHLLTLSLYPHFFPTVPCPGARWWSGCPCRSWSAGAGRGRSCPVWAGRGWWRRWAVSPSSSPRPRPASPASADTGWAPAPWPPPRPPTRWPRATRHVCAMSLLCSELIRQLRVPGQAARQLPAPAPGPAQGDRRPQHAGLQVIVTLRCGTEIDSYILYHLQASSYTKLELWMIKYWK